MNSIQLALRLLWRDWRAGELTLLLASLVIAVGTVTTITLFVDRLQQALLRESSTFLAADRVISSSRPLPPHILERADSLELAQARTLTFLSMVFAEDRAQFASVKAVDDKYPLRGTLIRTDEPFVRGYPVARGPVPGEIWLESRLFPALDVTRGDLLEIGVATFPAQGVLVKEPDRGGGFSNAGPRVMMHIDDVAATEVIQPGSRLTYRYLFAGEADALDSFMAWAESELGNEARYYGIRDGAQSIGEALDRGERFLLLGGLLGVILAGVAIALSAQRYSVRHYDHVAILKTLGATPSGIDRIFIVMFVVLGLAATICGSLVGYATQYGIVAILQPLIPIELPEPGMRPIWLGLVTGLICLLAFALPPLLKLRATEPVRVIRRDLGEASASDRATYAFGIGGTIGLMWWYSQDLWLTVLIFSGAVLAVVVLSVIAFLLLRGGRVFGMQAGSAWRLALAGMQRRGQENTMQILVFGLAIMLLLILFLVRTALIQEWQNQIPPDAPNHFAINISPEDVPGIQALMAVDEVAVQPLFPMIRGRIARINEVPVAEHEAGPNGGPGDDGPRAGSERNLTWADSLPPDNQVISGQWWSADYAGPALVSIEKDWARSNNLKVGDKLVFNIQGRELDAEVASIRTVAWDNMRPNFFLIFSPAALDDYPSTFITSFYLAKGDKPFLNKLLRAYPTMTVIEVDALIEQVQTIIAQVTLAIELVLVLILVSGGLVLLASVQASMDERLKQHAILRTLGAGQRLVLGSLAIEFCALGLFAGIVATIGAEFTVFMLETEIFELDYSVNPILWAVGPVVGTVLIGIVGTLATLRVVRTPPTVVLRGLN